MAERYCLLSLPPEVLEGIILSPVLSFCDIVNVGGVCLALRAIVSRLWGRIARSRWSSWGSLSAGSQEEWFELTTKRYLTEKRVALLLEELTHKCIHIMIADEEDLECFSTLIRSGATSPELLLLTLDEILRKPVREANFTHQFYGLYAKESIVREKLKADWQDLLSLPPEEQHLEKGAILLSQWMNPSAGNNTEAVVDQLDQIAASTASKLLREYDDEMEIGNYEDVMKDSSTSSLEHSTGLVARLLSLHLSEEVILDALNAVLYDNMGFKSGPRERYYDLENSFIDMVLKKRMGIPITMCTVYAAVARRLGVKLQPVNFPYHFLLKLSHTCSPTSAREDTLIDAFSRGRRLTPQQCLGMIGGNEVSDNTFMIAKPVQVYMRMAANIYSKTNIVVGHDIGRVYDDNAKAWSSIAFTSAIDLQLHLCSLVEDPTLAHTRVQNAALMCIDLNYNTRQVERVVSNIQARISNRLLLMLIHRARFCTTKKHEVLAVPLQAKERVEGMLYYVGMILKHRRYAYRCVVYGWDQECKMSDAWVLQMGVNQLARNKHQPFYNVLVEDGSNRYAAEDNLCHCPQPELIAIHHWEVGKYFCKFSKDRFIPNNALKKVYPSDVL